MATKDYERVEFRLYRRYEEDRDVIEFLGHQKDKSAVIRSLLIDHVRGSRYAELQSYTSRLEHELEILQRVVEKLTK